MKRNDLVIIINKMSYHYFKIGIISKVDNGWYRIHFNNMCNMPWYSGNNLLKIGEK